MAGEAQPVPVPSPLQIVLMDKYDAKVNAAGHRSRGRARAEDSRRRRLDAAPTSRSRPCRCPALPVLAPAPPRRRRLQADAADPANRRRRNRAPAQPAPASRNRAVRRTPTAHERPGPSWPGRGYFEDMRLRLLSAAVALAPPARGQQPDRRAATTPPAAAAPASVAGTSSRSTASSPSSATSSSRSPTCGAADPEDAGGRASSRPTARRSARSSLASLNELIDEELILAEGEGAQDRGPRRRREQHRRQAVQGRSAAASAARRSSERSSPRRATARRRSTSASSPTACAATRRITRTVRKLREDGKIVQANVTDAEVQESFDKSKNDLPEARAERDLATDHHRAASRRAAAKERARAHAESLLAEIKRGADFETLAKRESADLRIARQRRRPRMDPARQDGAGVRSLAVRLLRAARRASSAPSSRRAFGYHIIRVDRVNAGEVKSRHILITPKIDSADVARARLEADSVAAQWRAGAPFDSLAKKYHDFAQRRGDDAAHALPARAPAAAVSAGVRGQEAAGLRRVRRPGQRQHAGEVRRRADQLVEAGGDMTLAEVKERFRSRLAEEGGHAPLSSTRCGSRRTSPSARRRSR